ncbi:MAG TPA: hypothetical protein VKZ98_06220 [Aquaticitalea sp.]|nr:hypothetical protein [Aquaticitalea sp.]
MNKRGTDTIRDENLKINTRKDRRKFKRQFKEKPIATKKSYFQKHYNIFFLKDDCPENKKRFKVNAKLQKTKITINI